MNFVAEASSAADEMNFALVGEWYRTIKLLAYIDRRWQRVFRICQWMTPDRLMAKNRFYFDLGQRVRKKLFDLGYELSDQMIILPMETKK